jgi:hypothetical protein
MKLTRAPAMPPFGTRGSDLGRGTGFHGDLALGQVRGVAGLTFVQPGYGGAGFDRPLVRRRQPTAPSICSSISRFSSSAYSIGSSRAIGSTKPRTMVAAASSSVMPRLIR